MSVIDEVAATLKIEGVNFTKSGNAIRVKADEHGIFWGGLRYALADDGIDSEFVKLEETPMLVIADGDNVINIKEASYSPFEDTEGHHQSFA